MISSWPYLHTLINHFPIILTIVGTLAVLLALVYPRRGLWLYALGTLALAGITIYPAWLSGDRAADVVHKAWYIAPGAIRAHAQAADITMWLLLALGLASLIGWASIVRARDAFAPARMLRMIVAILAVVSLGAVAYTGYRGGQIVVESPILASPTPPVPALPATPIAPAVTPSVPQSQTPPGASPATPAPAVPVQPQNAPATQPSAQPPVTH